MKLHILNGDCLQDILQVENAIVVREMFVEGPIKADSFDALLRDRATYLEKRMRFRSMNIKENLFQKLIRLDVSPITPKFFYGLTMIYFVS